MIKWNLTSTTYVYFGSVSHKPNEEQHDPAGQPVLLHAPLPPLLPIPLPTLPAPQCSAVVPQLRENNNAMIWNKEIDLRTSQIASSIVLQNNRCIDNLQQLRHPPLYHSTEHQFHKSRMQNNKDHLHNRQPGNCQLDVRRDCISIEILSSFTYQQCTRMTAREDSH
jgi:hypothetical protein